MECIICFDAKSQLYNCGKTAQDTHYYCDSCLLKLNSSKCPQCNRPLDQSIIKELENISEFNSNYPERIIMVQPTIYNLRNRQISNVESLMEIQIQENVIKRKHAIYKHSHIMFPNNYEIMRLNEQIWQYTNIIPNDLNNIYKKIQLKRTEKYQIILNELLKYKPSLNLNSLCVNIFIIVCSIVTSFTLLYICILLWQ